MNLTATESAWFRPARLADAADRIRRAQRAVELTTAMLRRAEAALARAEAAVESLEYGTR